MAKPLDFNPEDIARWCGGEWCNGRPGRIAGVCSDSRAILQNGLFFALRGDRFDGHDFVEQAFAKGASCVVVDAGFVPAPGLSGPFLKTPDTRRALIDMAVGYRNQLGLQVVAVTGSVGKTTTKEMIADILSPVFCTARTKGNWNNDIGVPLSILSIAPGTRFGVMEVGMNHPGELRPLCKILSPGIGVITRIGPVHLEYFDSVEAIAREKSCLFSSLPENGFAVFNSDDDYAPVLENAASCRKVRVSMRHSADFSAMTAPDGGTLFVEPASHEAHRIKLKIPGEHNIANALCAAAVGRILNVGWPDIVAALESFKLPPMRWEESRIRGLNIINDAYNASPLSMRAALQAFSEMAVAGGKWLVLSEMRELGKSAEDEHFLLGELVAEGRWNGLVTIGNMGGLIALGAKSAGLDEKLIFQCRDIEQASELLIKKARKNDTILIKASRGVCLERILEFLNTG